MSICLKLNKFIILSLFLISVNIESLFSASQPEDGSSCTSRQNRGTNEQTKNGFPKKLRQQQKAQQEVQDVAQVSSSAQWLLFCNDDSSLIHQVTYLAYLEETINSSENEERRKERLNQLGQNEDSWLYVGDLFDSVAGVKKGSFLAAMIFYENPLTHERYRASEIAKLCIRYEHFLDASKTPIEMKDLLQSCFGDITQCSAKAEHIYLYGQDQ